MANMPELTECQLIGFIPLGAALYGECIRIFIKRACYIFIAMPAKWYGYARPQLAFTPAESGASRLLVADTRLP
jgi:hypothetical protein